ncbi:MAG: hypothetical protein ACTSXL_04345 [Alphaproteobacteria bacterium]|nr:MAG: hypothetical protein B6I23_01320 [Rickettsiaceae bacterium 4572_127]
MKFLKYLFFLLPFSVSALIIPNENTPFFDFISNTPKVANPIRYDVIFDDKGEAKLVENSQNETEEIEENSSSAELEKVPETLSSQTFSFSPKQKTISQQAKKLIQNLSDKMKINKKSKLTITLFFYNGTGFETAESKRLALKRSLAIKKELKKYNIEAMRIFIQIKETATKHTSHIAQILLKEI